MMLAADIEANLDIATRDGPTQKSKKVFIFQIRA
jgi:hypothetical protein